MRLINLVNYCLVHWKQISVSSFDLKKTILEDIVLNVETSLT